MKISKYSVISILLIIALAVSGLYAKERIQGSKGLPSLYKTSVASTGQFDGNRIRTDLENNGMVVSHRISGHSGLEWPKDNTTYAIYASGVWLAGKVGGQIRTAVAEYGPERVPGPWGSDQNDAAHKLYIVNKSDLADPLAFPDFQNWPTDLGAPWVDVNGNGIYEPLPIGPDHPDFLGDQVLWYVSNDGNPTGHSIFGTAPMGVEVQTTIFGFNRPDAFGDMLFVKELVINKGESEIEDTYMGIWSDPDLGDAASDFVGCDTTLGLGICYNDGVDLDYAGFSGGTPAIGYDFFQGPIVPSIGDTAFAHGRYIYDYRNLSMTSFSKYINSPDPVWSDPNDATEMYNLMMGLMKSGLPFAANITGGTAFVHPGDPTKDTGPTDTEYVDWDIHPSDDRRLLMNAGPFTMSPGDSQEVVFGIIIAAAGGPLDSYLYLKQVDALAQLAYDIQFALPEPPPNPVVNVTTLPDGFILTWDDFAEYYVAEDVIDKDENLENTEFVFEGYNVYQLETLSGSGDVKRIATFDLVNGLDEIYDDVFDANFGETINRRVQFGSDSGILRYLSIDQDALNNNAPLKMNRAYYFAVTAYGYNPHGIPKTLESPMQIIAARPQQSATWVANDETVAHGAGIETDHSAGGSDGSIDVTVIDPTELTGDDYAVFFYNQHYYRDLAGMWHYTNYPDSVGRMSAKTLDCTGSTVTGSAIQTEDGTVDIFITLTMHCGSNWVDGFKVDFPDDLTINSWEEHTAYSYGDQGQNTTNMVGTLDAATNSITWGDSSRTGFGAFEGDLILTVNVDALTLPIDLNYEIYDDGYDGTIADAIGISEMGYAFTTLFYWGIENVTTGEVILDEQSTVSGIAGDRIVDGVYYDANALKGANDSPVVDGFQVAVNGPSNGIHGVWQVSNADGPIAGIDTDVNENIMWINFLTAPDYPTEQAQGGWFFFGHAGGVPNEMTTDAGTGFLDRVFRGANFSYAIPYDFEMRFTTDALANGMGYLRFGDGETIIHAPFELWNVGTTPDDPSDDYRMIPAIYKDTGPDPMAWGFGGEAAHSGAANDPYSDWVYWGNPSTDMSPGQAGYDAFFANGIGGLVVNDDFVEVIARSLLMNWNGYASQVDSMALTSLSSPDTAAWTAADTALFEAAGWFLDASNSLAGVEVDGDYAYGLILFTPEVGTVYRLITNKPNTVADEFSFATSDIDGDVVAYKAGGVNVWPNPYFGYNPEERTPVDHQVHFTHLPEAGGCTIRIFDLAGVPVRLIDHTDAGNQYEVWDLKNNYGIPVASGMYIVHVETDAGDQILKIAVVLPEQRLDVY
ncbi:MAG: T9SS type A sorting domain-containing protein [Candidatus Neomarinimicrobiota bacterium]